MALLPTGRLGRSIHTIRDAMIANAAWISWCGGAIQAAADTYLVACPEGIRRCHALIDLDPGTFQRTRDGQTVGPFIHRGAVMLYLAAPVTPGLDENDAVTEFLNHADAVLSALEIAPALAGQSPVLNGISLAGGPTRIERQVRDKHGDMIEAMFLLDMAELPS